MLQNASLYVSMFRKNSEEHTSRPTALIKVTSSMQLPCYRPVFVFPYFYFKLKLKILLCEISVTETWKISDVIGIEEPSADAENTKEIRIHVIEDGEERKLIDKTASLEAEDHVLKEIVRKIKEKLNKGMSIQFKLYSL